MVTRRKLLLASAGGLLAGCAASRQEVELGLELGAVVKDPLQPLSGLSVLVQRQGRTVYEAQFGRRWIAPAGSGAAGLASVLASIWCSRVRAVAANGPSG